MRLTCATRSFPLDSLALSLARIHWAGFDAAEIAMDPDASALPDAAEIQALLDKAELELSAIDAGSLAFDSRDEALEAAAHLGRCALLAHQLDGPRVLFRAASGKPEHLAYALTSLASAMPGYAFELCPANAAGSLLADPEDFEELAGRFASERLGLALEPAAASAAGWDPDEFTRAAEVPLRYVYLTDTHGGQPALPGSGDLAWEALTTALCADGYDGYLSLLMAASDPLTTESDAKEARGLAEAWIHSAE